MSTDLVVQSRQTRKQADHARRVIGAIVREAREPVLFSCVRLTTHHDPAVLYPVVAQADLEQTGRTLQVRAGARNTAEAVDLLAKRLRRTLSTPPAGTDQRANRGTTN
jgi:hypothetical protein